MAREHRPELFAVITCEHGGNTIPREFRSLFADHQDVLGTHRGFDPGALELARRFAKSLRAPFHATTVSRLLIECNRTIGHPRHFSEFSRTLSQSDQGQLIERYYGPYRRAVETDLARLVRKGRGVHLSVHSFTPVMNGRTRRTDIGLLFDPARTFEADFCRAWRQDLRRALPDLAIHFNLPYRGTSDGLTTALRKQFPDARYAGIELEVNQKFPLGLTGDWKTLQQSLVESFARTLRSFDR